MSETSEIINDFLLDAPPGEFKQCAAAMTCIVSNKKLVESSISKTEKQWNHQQYTPVTINDHTAMICDESMVGDERYIDPVLNQVFKYNISKKSMKLLNETVNGSSLRNAIQARINEYALETYGETFAAGAYDVPNESNKVVVIMRSSSVSLSNYRTGIVIGRYIIDSENKKVEGSIKTQQHFFENGNAMSKFETNINNDLIGNSDDEIADSFIQEISKFETSFYDEYLLGLLKIGAEGLNHLRRKLPITASKINWEQELTTGSAMQI